MNRICCTIYFILLICSIEFLNTYHGIGSDIAAYGNPDWSDVTSVGKNDGRFGPALKRNSVKGSPVVPGSKKKIIEEGDMILYAVTVLRGHYESGYFVDDVFTPGRVPHSSAYFCLREDLSVR